MKNANKLEKSCQIFIRFGYLLISLLLIYLVILLLLPKMAAFKDELEQEITKQLGVNVTIGNLDSYLVGFNPALTLQQVKIGELEVNRFDVVLDVGKTIINADIYLDRLAVTGISLDFVQQQDNSWFVPNLQQFINADNDTSDFDISSLMQQAEKLGNVIVNDGLVTIKSLQQPKLILSKINFTANTHQASLTANLVNNEQIKMHAKYELNADDLYQSNVNLYLRVPAMDLLPFEIEEQVPQLNITALKAGADVWLTLANGELKQSSVVITADIIEAAPNGIKTSITDVSSTVYIRPQKDGLFVQVDDFTFTFMEQIFPKSQFIVEKQEQKWQLVADQVAIEPLFKLAAFAAPISKEVGNFFTGLKPRGNLRNIKVMFDPDVDILQGISFDAELDKVGISPYWHIPGTDNISGSVHGNPSSGELRLNAPNFSLHLAEFFEHNWQNHAAQGKLSWRIDPQKMQLALDYGKIQSAAGEFFGDMLLQISFNHTDEFDDFLDLRVGAKNADGKFTEQFLPTRIPAFNPELAKWLQTAIKSGDVREGFFEYQGSISAHDDMTARKINLYFDVDKAHLAYWQGWPDITKAKAQVFIENEQVQIKVNSARANNAQINQANAYMDYVGEDMTAHLKVNAKITANALDAVNMLKDAPIEFSSVFKDWQAQGKVKGDLYLDIPFAAKQDPVVKVDFNLQKAQLNLTNLKLDIRDINADITYDSRYGISAPKVSAKVLNSDISGKIISSKVINKPFSKLELTGDIDSADVVNWLDLPYKLPISGKLAYDFDMNLDNQGGEILINTDLLGVTIDAPNPVGKQAEDKNPTVIKVIFGADNLQIQGNYQQTEQTNQTKLVKFALNYLKYDFNDYRAALVFGDAEVVIPQKNGISVKGILDYVNAETWLQFAESIKPVDESNSQSQSQNSFNPSLILKSQLTFKTLDLYDYQLNNVELSFYGDRNFNFDIHSEMAEGKIVYNPRFTTLDLDYLYLKNEENKQNEVNKNEKTDVLADLDFAKIPNLSVNVNHFYVNNSSYGNFSFELNSSDDFININNILADIKGLNIDGELSWQKSDNNHQTSFKGNLSGKDLSQVLRNFDFAPTLVSKKFKTELNVNWPGTLLAFDLGKISGTGKVNIQNGRLLEVDSSAQALRVFGLLNFNSITRRLRFDFSDIFSKGLSYDRIKGEFAGDKGVFTTTKPFTLTGVSSSLEMKGSLNMTNSQVDSYLQVTMPLTSNLPIAAVIAGFNPAIGGALFVVDKMMGDKISKIASVNYHITGDISDPKFDLVSKSKK